jgi:hypothetical protein
MTEQQEAFSLGDNTLKLLSIAGPLLASSLAITHDVGFFVGTGIGFFSFFSLSEHLVFALQSLPFAILPAAVLLYWFGGVWFTFYRIESRDGVALAEETNDTHTVKPDPMQKWRVVSYLKSGASLLFFALIAVANVWFHRYVLAFLMVSLIQTRPPSKRAYFLTTPSRLNFRARTTAVHDRFALPFSLRMRLPLPG